MVLLFITTFVVTILMILILLGPVPPVTSEARHLDNVHILVSRDYGRLSLNPQP
jgi:hypothetical protein